MFSHVFVATNHFERALAFYRPLMAGLGLPERFCDPSRPWAGWQSTPGPRPLFLLGKPFDGEHQPGNGQMVALLAASRAQVDAAHATALAHGGRCEGPPGLRPEYHAHYYAAFVIGPDGHNIEVVCNEPEA